MHHTPESRAKMSASQRQVWADPASRHHGEAATARRSNLMHQRNLSGRGNVAYSRCAGGRRADLGETYYRSSWEANYARYLNFLVLRGEISHWEYEPQTFIFEAIRLGVRSYTPDFKVWFLDGRSEWHEVKGWLDPKSKTKLARMARYFPDEKVIVLGEGWFKAATKGVAHVIPNWERGGTRSQIMAPIGPPAPRQLKCPECPTTFVARSATHRHCSAVCRRIAKKARLSPTDPTVAPTFSLVYHAKRVGVCAQTLAKRLRFAGLLTERKGGGNARLTIATVDAALSLRAAS